MRAGEIVDERFEIERWAGSGGMGHVFRARDLATGEAVALKVLQGASSQDLGRFAREARTLAAVRNPGVVRYVAHGTTRLGEPYLAMEWLAGETLAARLERAPLTAAESLVLTARVAAALGEVHRLGLVHRDLKPTNLLLLDGAVERPVLIDFGIVRVSGIAQQLTAPGVILGTPGYMAPEQARGAANVDARADVFALGCVLYRCLTGRPAFFGAGALAVLAKVLLDEPPRVRELRGDLPAQLDALVARWLSKSPAGRPRDGDAAHAEISALLGLSLGEVDGGALASPSVPAREITTDERRVMCLLLVQVQASRDEATRRESDERDLADELAALVARYRGQLELIESRWPLIVFSGAGAPTDLAARAARCALAAQPLLDGAPIALVTGRAELSARLPVGEIVDRAVQLLPAGRLAGGAPLIRVDDVTLGLLGSRFETAEDDGGPRLLRPRDELDAPPELLGKPTACVGRDREIAMLAAEFERCVEESTSGAVLVTASAGMGKSRLRQELVRKLRERDDAVEVWIGQADPMSAGSPFGLIARALRRALGIVDGEPLAARQDKVRARVARRPELAAARVAAFLGELIGAPFPDEHDVQLRAARQSPMLMGDQLRLAWEELLRAECAAHPVVLVLEDLHWGDLPTVNLVDAALRHLKDRPFLALALGRPEVSTLFPRLWEGRTLQHLHLAPLPRRASERLVRQALGPSASDALVATLVARADGNAFFLEEQIRAAATGKTEGLPETVVAMVQARLEHVDAELRRALRAASVFGETFWERGVAALVGGVDVVPLLAELARREFIVRCDNARIQGEIEYRFRHALVREAAYGMLTEGDLRLGHRLAGDWLERTGAPDPSALAEHFERGDEPERAAVWYLRAAEEALRGNDLVAAIERSQRGVGCGAAPEIAGALRTIQAEAHIWRGEVAPAMERGIEATLLLEAGTPTWFAAFLQAITAACKVGDFDRVERWMDLVCGTPARDDALSARLSCLADGIVSLLFGGLYPLADKLLAALDEVIAAPSAYDAVALGKLHHARAIRALSDGDLGASLASMEAAAEAYARAGDQRNVCGAYVDLGHLYDELGDCATAERVLRVGLAESERLELREVIAASLNNLGLVLSQLDRVDEARAVEERALAIYREIGSPRMEGGCQVYLAKILLRAGELAAAEREARAAVAVLEGTPPLRAPATAVLARVLLAAGETAEALAAASEAIALLESTGAEEGESMIRLIYAEALFASGERDAAARAITAAADSLLARAAKIRDPAVRERFLGSVPDNARTLALARDWPLAEPSGG